MSWSLPLARSTEAISYGCMGRWKAAESSASANRFPTLRCLAIDPPRFPVLAYEHTQTSSNKQSSFAVTISSAEGNPMTVTDTRKLTVLALDRLADGVLGLSLADPAGLPLPAWTPGAHVDLHLGNGQIRQYSLCGDPAEKDRYRVAVLREANGRGGSAWIHDHLTVGE